MTKRRIRDWYDYWNGEVYVSFSGGKDSTVLLHIVREMYPDVEAVFVNTGLEYPEVQKFVQTFDNVTILRPAMSFYEVIKKYGYPIISKEVSNTIHGAKNSLRKGCDSVRLKKVRGELKKDNGEPSQFNCEKYEPLLHVDFNVSSFCCDVMKKRTVKEFCLKTGKKPITSQMADESYQRKNQWLKNGCNGFEMKNPVSNPMSFWTEQDVLQYIKENNIHIVSVYGDIVYKSADGYLYNDSLCGGKLCTTGCDRTGLFSADSEHNLKKEKHDLSG